MVEDESGGFGLGLLIEEEKAVKDVLELGLLVFVYNSFRLHFLLLRHSQKRLQICSVHMPTPRLHQHLRRHVIASVVLIVLLYLQHRFHVLSDHIRVNFFLVTFEDALELAQSFVVLVGKDL